MYEEIAIFSDLYSYRGECIVNYHKFRILSNAYNKRVGKIIL